MERSFDKQGEYGLQDSSLFGEALRINEERLAAACVREAEAGTGSCV